MNKRWTKSGSGIPRKYVNHFFVVLNRSMIWWKGLQLCTSGWLKCLHLDLICSSGSYVFREKNRRTIKVQGRKSLIWMREGQNPCSWGRRLLQPNRTSFLDGGIFMQLWWGLCVEGGLIPWEWKQKQSPVRCFARGVYFWGYKGTGEMVDFPPSFFLGHIERLV